MQIKQMNENLVNKDGLQWNPRCNAKIYKDNIIITNMDTGNWTIVKKNVFNNLCYYMRQGETVEEKLRTIEKELIDRRILIGASELALKRHPEIISIMLTNLCNLSCKHCCVDDISWNEGNVYYVIDEVVKINPLEIMITGGEPMVSPIFFDVLKYLRSKYQGKICLSTNGTLIDEKNVSILGKLIDKFDISIDGTEEKNASIIRGKGVWEKVIHAIELLKSNGVINISMSMVLTDYNRMSIQKFYALNEKYGTYPIIRNVILNKNVIDNIDELFDGGFAKYRRDELKRIQNMKINNHYMGRNSCGMIRYQLFITANGDIYPCGGLAIDKFLLGNLKEIGGLEAFYEREKSYIDFVIDKMLKSSELMENCQICGLRDLCWKCMSIVYNYLEIPECFKEYCGANIDNITRELQI